MSETENITLLGNPNVGKSTVFNLLTGMHQHTGNWSGKTVGISSGNFTYGNKEYCITDLPGIYSFSGESEDEIIAENYLKDNLNALTVVVCDATTLERSLILALRAIDLCKNVIVIVNLIDEAERKGICINFNLLKKRLGVPVLGISAKNKRSKKSLLKIISGYKQEENYYQPSENEKFYYIEKAENVCHGVITLNKSEPDRIDRKIDKILMGKYTAVPCMIIILLILFYITLSLASVPSDFLMSITRKGIEYLHTLKIFDIAPPWVESILLDGMLTVLSWVVSVMLPPMAIFFPLFIILEDLGYLPRAAFTLDNTFKKCGTCGKQALTMCMGLGCNCAGITGCRIIKSQNIKLNSIITNVFTPCNGRFPMLITIITAFFLIKNNGITAKIQSSFILVIVLVFSLSITFAVSKLLSKTILKDEKESFTMELPPYRIPRFGKVIVRSIYDKTLNVLLRAIVVAAPAGILLWILTHLFVGDKSIFLYITEFLNPIGNFLGLDGTILTAFILGLPANEIVIPIIIMGYSFKDTLIPLTDLSDIYTLFTENGWTILTAVNMIIFTVCHWPCSTAIITIKKETNSLKWTVVSIAIPTITGVLLCLISKFIITAFA